MSELTYRTLADEAKIKFVMLDPQRIERALVILDQHTCIMARVDEEGQTITPTQAAYAVKSGRKCTQPDPVWHIVRPATNPDYKRCTCYDSAESRHICKHRIAVYLYTELPRRQFAQAAQPARRAEVDILAELGVG